jgi:hypothetical protein
MRGEKRGKKTTEINGHICSKFGNITSIFVFFNFKNNRVGW